MQTGGVILTVVCFIIACIVGTVLCALVHSLPRLCCTALEGKDRVASRRTDARQSL